MREWAIQESPTQGLEKTACVTPGGISSENLEALVGGGLSRHFLGDTVKITVPGVCEA